jgi:1,4-dihydroxy-2-naphthoate octaprenyltransferase
LPAVAALAVAFFLQISANLANDYFDFKKGIDTRDRIGPVRVTQSGLIPSQQVKLAMVIMVVLAALPGLYLIIIGGWPVVIIGSACILAALAYSGGPYPLASHGLGDLFVFVFFGIVAVCGTYYVQALRLKPMVLVMGTLVGLIITAILVVNNLRDIQTDQRAGKRTLAVILGVRATKFEYSLLHACAYIMPIVIWICGLTNAFILFPLLSLPLAIPLNRTIWKNPDGATLNQTLAGTARLALIFSLLLSIGLILS